MLLLIVKQYETLHGRKVNVWLNTATDLAGQRECDILDEFGVKWEVKFDRLAKVTGNVFLEHTALKHSSSNFVIYSLTDVNYVTTLTKLLDIIDSHQFKSIHGGDFRKGKANPGTLLPVSELEKISYRLE